MIVCERFRAFDGQSQPSMAGPTEIVISDSLFDNPQVVLTNTAGYAKVDKFLVMTQLMPDGQNTTLHVTLDGKTFARAHFPGENHLIEIGYTILESQQHAITL